MNPLVCQNQKEFDAIGADLKLFAQDDANHNRIVLDQNGKPIATTAKACWLSRVVQWIKRLFTCRQHPAHRVADCALAFFEANETFLKPYHALAVEGIRRIKKVTDPAIPGRITHLLDVIGDTNRYLEAHRKELDHERETTRRDCEAMKAEAVRTQNAADAALQAAHRNAKQIDADAKGNAAEIERQVVEAARTVRAKADTYRTDTCRATDEHCAKIREQALEHMRKTMVEAQNALQAKREEGRLAYEAELLKAREIVKNACDEASRIRDDAIASAKKTTADEEAKIRKALALKEQEIQRLEAKSRELGIAHYKALQSMDVLIGQGKDQKDQLIAQGNKAAEATLAKAAKEADALKQIGQQDGVKIIVDARKEADAIRKKAEQDGEALKKEIEGRLQATRDQLDALNKEKVKLEADKAGLVAKIQAMQETRITIYCKDGTIPDMRFSLLKDLEYLCTQIKWTKKTDDELKQAKADGLVQRAANQAEAKGAGAQPAVPPGGIMDMSPEDDPAQLLETHKGFLDLRAHKKNTVEYFLKNPVLKLPVGFDVSGFLGAWIELFTLYAAVFPKGDVERLKIFTQFFGDKGLVPFLLRALAAENPNKPFQEFAFSLIDAARVKEFTAMKELGSVSRDMMIRILKSGHALDKREVIRFVHSWFKGACKGQPAIELLTDKGPSGESIWDLCFKNLTPVEQSGVMTRFLGLSDVEPEPMAGAPAAPAGAAAGAAGAVAAVREADGKDKAEVGIGTILQSLDIRVVTWEFPERHLRIKPFKAFYSASFGAGGHTYRFGLIGRGEGTYEKQNTREKIKDTYYEFSIEMECCLNMEFDVKFAIGDSMYKSADKWKWIMRPKPNQMVLQLFERPDIQKLLDNGKFEITFTF